MKKLALVTMLCIAGLGLGACSINGSTSNNPSQETKVSDVPAAHQDIRLAFNNIKLGNRDNDFSGGSTLEDLKNLFGEPAQTFQTPAGDVTLDGYTWQFDTVTVTVNLLRDSAITRAISNFNFIRFNTISKQAIAQIADGMTFQQAIDLLGQPDVYSESVSSDNTRTQALWVSGIEGASNQTQTQAQAQISLEFTDDRLTHKTLTNID
ncbi:DUF3862 domain-containing protein [Streptococcus sp. zg-JUN1979]|uniref:DUF3862 domain-containing protein n=1 Tax=Streptococcus sp. zg-JUN1979 TaxID=3391450 RepID=UPI0039A4A4AE